MPDGNVRQGRAALERACIQQALSIRKVKVAPTRVSRMPFSYTIDRDANLIRETWTGAATVADLRQISLDEWADPRYRPGVSILSDFRAARVTITYQEMVDYTRFLAGHGVVAKQAIVVATQLGFGLARMFELLTEDDRTIWESLRIFTDMDDAERWLSAP